MAACAEQVETSSVSTGAGGSAGAGGTPDVSVGVGGSALDCECVPGDHNDRIYTLSDDGQIWSFDPNTNDFTYVRNLLCTGAETPYSMAIDRTGQAWVVSVDTGLVFVLALDETQGCEVSAYTPHQASFDLFGMAFARPDPMRCEQLYVHSYSGDGPFSEGPDAGELGVIDPESGVLSLLGSVDYDGGELAGTGNGRLFALAGVNPVKLIEYDPSNATVLATLPFTGLEKTNASAFAFYAGDFFVFTEAIPPSCMPCMMSACGSELQACLADPACKQQLDCALAQGDINDECGGGMPTAMQSCLSSDCGSECLIPSSAKVSQVTRVDYDGTQNFEVVVAQAPIRIVGAGVSVCVPAVAK